MAKQRTIGDRIFRACAFIGMGIFAFTYILLLLWMILSSFRTQNGFATDSFQFNDITWEQIKFNYIDAFTYEFSHGATIPMMIVNSLVYVVGSLIITTAMPCITGYIFAKYQFKIRTLLLNIIVLMMVIPTVGSMVVTYRFLDSLGLVNNGFWAILLMSSGGLGFGALMYRNYFAAIPWSYAESAFLDGAGNFTVFIRIMLPQAVPLIVSLCIMGFIGTWNDFMTPYIYANKSPTLAVGLQQLTVDSKIAEPSAFAAMTFSTVIVLIVFCCFSDMIMNNMSAGGLKE